VKKKSAKKRTRTAARKRPARRKRAGGKRVASKPARKKVSTKKRAVKKRPARARSAKRPVRAPSRSRSAKRPARRRAALTIVPKPAATRRPRATHPPAPAFPQREGASAKQLLLFELLRARAAFLGAIQGLTPGAADRPMGEGKWSARETVLHLLTRDLARLREMEAALQGRRASWETYDDATMSRVNAETLAPLRHLPWDDALRLMHAKRQELLEALESVPEEPAEVWQEPHAFGWMFQRLPGHDRHHAEIVRQWRAGGAAPQG
jgi:hypothetical protein